MCWGSSRIVAIYPPDLASATSLIGAPSRKLLSKAVMIIGLFDFRAPFTFYAIISINTKSSPVTWIERGVKRAAKRTRPLKDFYPVKHVLSPSAPPRLPLLLMPGAMLHAVRHPTILGIVCANRRSGAVNPIITGLDHGSMD